MWITDWSLIDDDARYIVATINDHNSAKFLENAMHAFNGRSIKTFALGRYAALPMPEWDGVIARKEDSK